MRRSAIIAVLTLTATQGALAASAIPSGELPGRERYRFVDPPGAGLMLPTQPSVQFPWDGRPAGQGACVPCAHCNGSCQQRVRVWIDQAGG